MSVTFIHFSDTHLGFSDLDLIDDNSKNIREEDVYNSFRNIVDIIIKKKPDFVIHTGDIFHRSSPTNKPLIVAAREIQRIAVAGIPFFMIAGNHDYPKSVSTTPIHDLYASIPECRIFYSEKYEVHESDNYILHLLPHINNETKFLSEVKKIEVVDKSKPNILLMHLSMPSFRMNEFGEGVFPPESINILKDFDYVALGHWHRFNHLKKYGNVYYSGSTEIFSDRETGYKKGIVKVTIDGKLDVEFIPVETRYYQSIEITECSSKNKDQIIGEVKKATKESKIDGSVFTIQLSDLSPTQVYEISKTDFAEIFRGALYFNVSKTVKGSSEKFEYDSETFDLREQLNEDLKENFKDKSEFQKVSKLTERFLCEIEEEEEDAD